MLTLGEKIRLLRKYHGWTGVLLAEKMATSKQVVSNWETDESAPTVEQLKRLARFAEIHPVYFFDNLTPEEALIAEFYFEYSEILMKLSPDVSEAFCCSLRAVYQNQEQKKGLSRDYNYGLRPRPKIAHPGYNEFLESIIDKIKSKPVDTP